MPSKPKRTWSSSYSTVTEWTRISNTGNIHLSVGWLWLKFVGWVLLSIKLSENILAIAVVTGSKTLPCASYASHDQLWVPNVLTLCVVAFVMNYLDYPCFCGASKAKCHLGITLSVIHPSDHRSVCHALLLLVPHASCRTLVYLLTVVGTLKWGLWVSDFNC